LVIRITKKETGKFKKERVYRIVRFSIQLLIFVALVALTTLLLRPLRNTMQNRMIELRDRLLAQAESIINRKIEYGAMGPSLFGVLDIRNIRIYGAGGEPLAAIARFRLSYSLGDLIRGKPLESLRSIRIDRPVLTLDWERDADLRALFSSGDRSPGGLPPLPENFRIRIRNGTASVGAGENYFHSEGIVFDGSIRAGRILFQGRWNLETTLAGYFGQPFETLVSGRIDGEMSSDFRSGSLNLTLPSLSGDRFRLSPLTLNLSLGDDRLELRKINDRLPFDFYLIYEFDSDRISASFRAEDFLARDLVSFTGSWRDYNPWLAVRTSGAASFRRSAEEGTVYTIDLSGAIPPDLPMGPTSFAVTGGGDEKYIGFEQFYFQFPQGNFRFAGGTALNPLAPNGTLSISDLSLTGEGRVNAELSISTMGRSINLFGESVSLGSVFLSALDGNIQMEDDGFTFDLSALRFRDIESYEDVRLSSFSLDGSFDSNPRHLQGSLTLDAFSLADMVAMAGPFVAPPALSPLITGIVDDLAITTEVFVNTDFDHILYNAPRLVVAYGGGRDIFALLSVSGTDRRFELNEGRVVWEEEGLDASGYADFSDLNDISFSLRTAYRDLSYYLEGVMLDRRSLDIQGSYGLQVHITRSDFGGYSGYIEIAALPVPFRGQFARLSLSSSLRYDTRDFWSLDIDNLEVQDLALPASPAASLRISGGIDQDGAVFPQIFFDDGRGGLSGRALASWGRGFTEPSGFISISDQEGLENYQIQGVYAEEYLDIFAEGFRIQLGRWIPNMHNALASGDLRLIWHSLDSYSVTMNIDSLSLRNGETRMGLSAALSLDEEEFRIDGLRVNYGGLTGEMVSFKMDHHSAAIETGARLRGTALGRDIDVSFDMAVSFNPIDSWLDMGRIIEAFDGVLNIRDIRLDTTQSQDPFSFAFSRSESLISLAGGPGDMLRLRISGDGDFYAAFSNPSPIRGTVIGSINSKTIDAQASQLYVDLSSLWRFIPRKDIINFTGGFVLASVQIKGPLGDPEFFGVARGNSLRIQVPQYIAADIEVVPVTVVLEGNEMAFGPIPARVGSGAGTASGWFRFDRWIPNIFSLDITVPQESSIPFGVDMMGIMAKGSTWGRLNLSMEDYILTVTGDLTGHDTEITLDTRQLASGQFGTFNTTSKVSVVADINIHTGRKVEFAWPFAELPLVRTYADVGSSVRITSDVASGRYSVVGDVDLRSGEIFYFQRSFYIREGMLVFNENEVQFEPRLTARAEIRDRTDEGPVTIRMIIENAPIMDFTARFEADPSLSQFDIFSLLGQNLTGIPLGDDGSGGQRAFLSASSDILAQFNVVRRFERHIRDFLRLDMFSIRTQVLQNAVFQATGLQNPVDRNGGVGNYFDNTTVFLGKYIGSNMFAQAMLSLRYDENQTEIGALSAKGLSLGGGLYLEPDIGLEIRGSTFGVRWDFIPRHLENMFIDDHSFTLTWRWSF
jgi:hypothetical protein